MQSTTHQFNKKESLNDIGSALSLSDFSLLSWDTKEMFNLPQGRPVLRDLIEQIKIFPEAKEYLKQQLIYSNKVIKKLEEAQKEYDEIIYRKSKGNEWFWEMIIDELLIGPPKKIHQDIIKRNSFILEKKKFTLSIEKAKTYPIDQLIEFRQHTAKCIWHNEKTGSLHYYKKTNTVKCFGCGEWGDVIKVYQQLNKCSFKEALKALQ